MREFDLLVVDDDRIYLNMVKLLFEEAGLKVACADSGEEALKMMEERPFGLILTDFNMPRMNGIELAGRIRDMAPDARIVMTTSDPSPEITEMAMGAGISRVIAKPRKIKDVLNIINDEKQWLIESLKELYRLT